MCSARAPAWPRPGTRCGVAEYLVARGDVGGAGIDEQPVPSKLVWTSAAPSSSEIIQAPDARASGLHGRISSVPTIIVLDANILVASPRLHNSTWQSLVEHRDDWDVRLVVPEVAVMEAAKNVPVKWGKTRALMPNPRKFKEFGHDSTLQTVLDDIDAGIDSFARDLDERLAAMSAEIIPPPTVVDLMDLARRAAAGRAPYCAGDKDGFRDALIWLSVLGVAQDNLDAEVWFVSNNTDDFGPAGDADWTGPGTGARDDCPILFHSDLIEDLERLGLTERVHYVTNINSLEQHLAAKFAPITTEDLRASLDEAQLIAELGVAVRGLRLDPYLAALDPNTEAAVITGAVPVSDSWHFHDGAQRDAMGWTAKFTVTADTVIAWTTTDTPDKLAVQEKRLSVTGDLTVGVDGMVQLDARGMTALPDDPMRELWPSPTAVAHAQQTAAIAQEKIVRFLHAAGPHEHPDRVMAEVNQWQDAAANANRILDSDAVKRALFEMRPLPAKHASLSQAFSQWWQNSPAERATFNVALSELRDSPPPLASLSQTLSEWVNSPAAQASLNVALSELANSRDAQASSVSQALSELANSPTAQASVNQAYRDFQDTQEGTGLYSAALRRAFDALQRNYRWTHLHAQDDDSIVPTADMDDD